MPKSQFSAAYAIFVEMLSAARKKTGLTQTDLAERLGRKQGHISIIETGVRRVDIIEFCAIAKALDLDPVDFFKEIYRKLPDELDV